MTTADAHISTYNLTVSASESRASDEQRAQIMSNPGFGDHFSDHMARATWTKENGWGQLHIQPYGPIELDPAASVLHYAQEVFEGMKAYRRADDTVWAFRPEENAARMADSADRLALPAVPEDLFMDAVAELTKIDVDWVPAGGESSYYLRPFMFSSEAFLGVRAGHRAEFLVIGGPAGSYFTGGIKPVDLWLSTKYSRAGDGGTGAAKCGGNYASSLQPIQEAHANGCGQTLFLDAAEHQWIEELGGMNLFLVNKSGDLITPELDGSILPGVTRKSLIELAEDAGRKVQERRVHIDEWREGVRSGDIVEVFACGTAAVVVPVGELVSETERVPATCAQLGPVAGDLRQQLLDIQYGRSEDAKGWTRRLV